MLSVYTFTTLASTRLGRRYCYQTSKYLYVLLLTYYTGKYIFSVNKLANICIVTTINCKWHMYCYYTGKYMSILLPHLQVYVRLSILLLFIWSCFSCENYMIVKFPSLGLSAHPEIMYFERGEVIMPAWDVSRPVN